MTETKLRMELEVRQNTTDFTSHEAVNGNVNNVTVLNNEFHPNGTAVYDKFRAYVVDNHDVSFDVTIQHMSALDEDYDNPLSLGTISLSGGNSVGTVVFDGPVGHVLFEVLATSASSAPSSGSMQVEVLGMN